MKTLVTAKQVPGRWSDRKIDLRTGMSDGQASASVPDEMNERALEAESWRTLPRFLSPPCWQWSPGSVFLLGGQTKNDRLNMIYPVEVARAIHFPVMLYFVLLLQRTFSEYFPAAHGVTSDICTRDGMLLTGRTILYLSVPSR